MTKKSTTANQPSPRLSPFGDNSKAHEAQTGPISGSQFLSSHQIRYDGIGLQGNPDEIFANLIQINKMRNWISTIGKFEDLSYHTPGFVSSPMSSTSFSPSLISLENRAMQAYYTALQTGDLQKVHDATDAINLIRMQKGGVEFVPISDFQIICHGNSLLALNGRHLISERAEVEETGFGSYAGSPLPWFDTYAAWTDLLAHS